MGNSAMQLRQSRGMVPAASEGPLVEGGDEARELIAKFLMHTVGEVKGATAIWQLFQHGMAGNEPLQQNEFELENINFEELSDEIITFAEEDIASCGNHKILYGLRLLHHNGRRNFQLKVGGGGSGGTEMDAFGNESDMVPTGRNMNAQLMGHLQAVMQMNVGQTLEQFKIQQKAITRAYDRIQWLEAERERYMLSREAIMSQQHERDMDSKKQEKKDFRIDQAMSMGINAIAPLVNKYVGHALIPEKATPLEAQIITLASTMRNDQLKALMTSGIFDQGQLSNFVQMIQVVSEGIEEEKRKVSGKVQTSAGQASATDGVEINGSGSNGTGVG